MPSDQLESIVQSLAEKFVAELRAGVMGALRESLFGRPAPAAMAAAAPKSPQPKKGKARKAKTRSKTQTTPAKKPAAKAPSGATNGAHGELAAKIATALAKHPDGLRSEDIQKSLDLSKVDAASALAAGLKAGLLRKHGKARGTKYRVGPKASAAAA